MKQILSRMTMLAILSSCINLSAFADTKFDPPQVTANGQYQLEGNWSELKHGWSNLILKVTGQDQQPVIGAKVDVAYDMVGMPMNPPSKPVVDKGDGTYVKPVFVGMRGTWQFDIAVTEAVKGEDTLSRQQKVLQ